MKKLASVAALIALAVTQVGSPAGAATLSEEFSGSSLDATVWTAGTGKIGGLCVSSDNAVVSSGSLRMTVEQGTTTDCPWVGARLVTAGKRYFDYGLTRARIKWNPAPGFWGGFVMLGEASGGRRIADGEIDVEIRYGKVHYRLWSVNSSGRRCGVPIDKPNYGLYKWHVFGVDRQASYVSFSIDGVTQATITKAQMLALGCTWPFDRQFSWVLSARAGGWGGTPDPTRYPVTTLVDWVRK